MTQEYSKNNQFDYIVLLEPTSPLRKKDDLKKIIEKAVDHAEADGLITLEKSTWNIP